MNMKVDDANKYSISNYISLLSLIKRKGYVFSPFTIEKPVKKTVFLRHDIDYSPKFALDIAKINSDLNVHGTFFFQLRCPLYNILDFDVLRILDAIQKLDQHIGFHLVIPNSNTDYTQIYKLLQDDFEILQHLVPGCEPVFAWHNPADLSADGFNLIKAEFEGFVNVYGIFAGKKYPYYADSNLRYSIDDLKSIVERDEPVFQLALAPMQWCPERKSMLSILAANLIQKIRDMETVFMTNSSFSKHFPRGLPEIILENLELEIKNNARDF